MCHATDVVYKRRCSSIWLHFLIIEFSESSVNHDAQVVCDPPGYRSRHLRYSLILDIGRIWLTSFVISAEDGGSKDEGEGSDKKNEFKLNLGIKHIPGFGLGKTILKGNYEPVSLCKTHFFDLFVFPGVLKTSADTIEHVQKNLDKKPGEGIKFSVGGWFD